MERSTEENPPAWKRALDIFCIIISLPLLLPVAFLVAAIIRIASPGPVLFKQERVGFRGKRFMVLKFRTMHVNADVGVHKNHLSELMKSKRPMNKLDGKDPRIIPAGVVIRAMGLDELPQIINVVRGEMSLVGPRPCIPYEFEQFLPHYQHRCDTLPGMTGLWQVNGKNKLTFEQMMHLDLEYVRRKSVLLDLVILLRTPVAVLLQLWDTKIRKIKPVQQSPIAPHPQPQALTVK